MNKIPRCEELFDISHTIAGELLSKCEYPYLALDKIDSFIMEWVKNLPEDYSETEPGVYVARTAKIWKGATICPPAIIGHRTELRPGAFIRGSVIIGDDAVIGNSTEIKNSIVLDLAQLPHYNYVGDSIIGYKAHLGAGAIASNLRLDRREISIKDYEDRLPTGRRKLGVLMGDKAEVGCGCVICPGTVICPGAMIYPLLSVRGVVPANSIYKGDRY